MHGPVNVMLEIWIGGRVWREGYWTSKLISTSFSPRWPNLVYWHSCLFLTYRSQYLTGSHNDKSLSNTLSLFIVLLESWFILDLSPAESIFWTSLWTKTGAKHYSLESRSAIWYNELLFAFMLFLYNMLWKTVNV